MSTLSEVELALAVICHAVNNESEPTSLNNVWLSYANQSHRSKLKQFVTLLHCTSLYPTAIENTNLLAMDALKVFDLPIGYSDHTEGTLVPIIAVARGATIIEKHFTLNKDLPGPDHKMSLEFNELKTMTVDIRSVTSAFGDGIKAPNLTEWDTMNAARQCIVAAKSISKGEIFKRNDLKTARFGDGLSPEKLWDLVGKQSKFSYDENVRFYVNDVVNS